MKGNYVNIDHTNGAILPIGARETYFAPTNAIKNRPPLKSSLDIIKQRNKEVNIPDLCASFQDTVTDVLLEKSMRAIKEYDAKMFMIAGGVAANKGLRKKISERITNVKVVVPEFKYCTDNAAMIGVAGYHQFNKTKEVDDMSLNGKSRIKLS